MAEAGRVVSLPARRYEREVARLSKGAGVLPPGRRLSDEPSGVVDDWGRDPGVVRRAMRLAGLRWQFSTGGATHLPKRTGALIVVNTRRFALTTLYTAFAVSPSVDRPVRFIGRSDSVPLGPLEQRLGALLDHPDEVFGALRGGELVVLGADPTARPREAGLVDHTIVGAAVAAGVRVHPAATTSSPFNRFARVEIGKASRPPRTRRGPLVELELADRVRDDIMFLLDQMGDINTGTPLDLLPLGGLGGGR